MSPVTNRLTFDQLAAISADGAGNGPTALPSPALVPLADFYSISTPWQVPEARAVVADQVNVGARTSGARYDGALGIMKVPVVLLNHNVVGCLSLPGAAVLGVKVSPTWPLQDESHLPGSEVDDHQPVGRVRFVPIAEKARERKSLTVR